MIEFKRILVPLDGSSLSEEALPLATTLAQTFGSEIVLLRTWEVSMPPTSEYSGVYLGWMDEAYAHAREEVESYLKARQDALRRQGLDVEIVLLGDHSPAEKIIDTAVSQNVDLIVMSTHGRSGLARWALGSVADKVVRHSPCPVLLNRQPVEPVNEPQLEGDARSDRALTNRLA